MSLVTDRHDWWSAQIGGLHTDPLQRWLGSKSYTTHVYEPTAVSIARRLSSLRQRERERTTTNNPLPAPSPDDARTDGVGIGIVGRHRYPSTRKKQGGPLRGRPGCAAAAKKQYKEQWKLKLRGHHVPAPTRRWERQTLQHSPRMLLKGIQQQHLVCWRVDCAHHPRMSGSKNLCWRRAKQATSSSSCSSPHMAPHAENRRTSLVAFHTVRKLRAPPDLLGTVRLRSGWPHHMASQLCSTCRCSRQNELSRSCAAQRPRRDAAGRRSCSSPTNTRTARPLRSSFAPAPHGRPQRTPYGQRLIGSAWSSCAASASSWRGGRARTREPFSMRSCGTSYPTP
jgi:hypothetical protein